MSQPVAQPVPSTSANEYHKYYDLGSFHRPVSTHSLEAQSWFDAGLTWSYAFNHEEAAFCFEHAISHDPTCAIAYWGLAYALGPNYNKPWESFDEYDLGSTVERTHNAMIKAQETAKHALPVEQALFRALGFRYPRATADSADDFPIWNDDYAREMGLVYKQFPEDLDIATLFADALMNLKPWGLFDLKTGQPAAGAR